MHPDGKTHPSCLAAAWGPEYLCAIDVDTSPDSYIELGATAKQVAAHLAHGGSLENASGMPVFSTRRPAQLEVRGLEGRNLTVKVGCGAVFPLAEYIYIYIYIYMYIHLLHICTHVHILCTYVYVYIQVCVCVYLHIHSYTCFGISIRLKTYTHT